MNWRLVVPPAIRLPPRRPARSYAPYGDMKRVPLLARLKSYVAEAIPDLFPLSPVQRHRGGEHAITSELDDERTTGDR